MRRDTMSRSNHIIGFIIFHWFRDLLSPMKNITVSSTEALALKLRVEAAKADKSLSRFLSETLERALFGASGERAATRIEIGRAHV